MSIPVEELARAAEKSTFYRPSFGEVFKINRDPERISHGFVTNQNCSPLVFLEEIPDFGWYKYDIVQIGDLTIFKENGAESSKFQGKAMGYIAVCAFIIW